MEIFLKKVCEKGIGIIYFDPRWESVSSGRCYTGEREVDVAILGDRNLNKIGDVEVKCAGCECAPSFSKILKKKII